MKQYNHRGKFTITIPEDWTAVYDEGVIELQHQDYPLGVLQFSVLYPPEDEVVSLKETLIEFLEDYTTEYTITDTPHHANTNYFKRGNMGWWKFWTIKKDDMVIFGTYGCEKEEWCGKEDHIVNEIIDSI